MTLYDVLQLSDELGAQKDHLNSHWFKVLKRYGHPEHVRIFQLTAVQRAADPLAVELAGVKTTPNPLCYYPDGVKRNSKFAWLDTLALVCLLSIPTNVAVNYHSGLV